MHDTEATQEAARLMTICNACRYCEGLCAVFPAMEQRLEFPAADIAYLANLCHQCGACYDACQYVPPHEFAVNVPQALAVARADSYAAYAWPGFLAPLLRRNGLAVLAITTVSLIGLLLAVYLLRAPDGVLAAPLAGDFYRVIPHAVMAAGFSAIGLYVLLALGLGFARFWRDVDGTADGRALGRALLDALRLRYLDGGGAGCTVPTERPSNWRRLFHHFTFYGFLLCFTATSVATLYHYGPGWQAPYGYVSLPVLLGSAGGIGLIVGPLGLLWVRARTEAPVLDPGGAAMAQGFLWLLLLVSLTGLALLLLRDSAAMGLLLTVHLGFVLALFLTLPYGKFVHAIYRFGALVKYAREQHGAD